ncbi:MAG: hypothetical protein PUJ43_04465, partial [Bacillales bacterium]|nr:hypothetical protein [Bacillales bacterium]MDY5919630.1 hypothetical protein [Candidatus Enteromonas sp.]
AGRLLTTIFARERGGARNEKTGVQSQAKTRVSGYPQGCAKLFHQAGINPESLERQREIPVENLVTIVSETEVIHRKKGRKSFPQVIHIFHLGKT